MSFHLAMLPLYIAAAFFTVSVLIFLYFLIPYAFSEFKDLIDLFIDDIVERHREWKERKETH